EHNVFPLSEVRTLLRDYERVQLYTDEVPAEFFSADPGYYARKIEARANDDFKFDKSVFGTQQLPLYVILVPQSSGKLKADVYQEGAINKPAEFISFLKKGLGQAIE
ncbi:MAG TPA: hypothetical protein VG097_14695, partial [Gemmata sp.]|nr:hypothetical protein [Gemmata sp.]